MAYSKAINIFLPTGSADGPIELDMLNWNGKVVKLPRKDVAEYSSSDEDGRLDVPGIYFLFSTDEEHHENVYVGEAENILRRLKQHITDYNSENEKFFWPTAVCVKGKDLDKALIRYLENYYCGLVNSSSRFGLLTQKSSSGVPLKRAELAAMTEFVDNVNMLMGTIGYKLAEDSSEEVEKDRTFFFCKSKSGGDAKGYFTDDGFVVVKGSKVSPECSSKTFTNSIYKKVFDKLVEDAVIVDYVFLKDYTFQSPTAAADVVLQSYVSGTEYWIDANGKKVKEYNI